MIAYLVSHLMCSTSSANPIDHKSSSTDFHIKWLLPDETVVVHENSLSDCLADSEVASFVEAPICQDPDAIFCFGTDVTVLVYLSR